LVSTQYYIVMRQNNSTSYDDLTVLISVGATLAATITGAIVVSKNIDRMVRL